MKGSSKISGFNFRVKAGAFAAMLLASLAIYANTIGSAFHFDDQAAIVRNVEIRHFNDPIALWNAFNTRFFLGLTFAANYAAGKLDPSGYHLINILLHGTAAYFVYRLVSVTLELCGRQSGADGVSNRWAAFGAALIFVAHPIQTQAVNIVWQRAAVLAALFSLAAMTAYAEWRTTGTRRHYAAALACVALAMLSKETAFTLPVVLLAYELLIVTPRLRSSRPFSRKSFLPFGATLAIIPLLLTRASQVTMDLMRPNTPMHATSPGFIGFIQKMRVSRWVGEEVMSRHDYYLTQVRVMATYLRLLVFPAGQNLDYNYPAVRTWASPEFLAPAGLLLMIFAMTAVYFKKNRFAAFMVVWYFLSLSLESLVVQSDVLFEHRLYLPMAAFAGLAAAASAALLRTRRRWTVFMAVVLLCLSAAAWKRNLVWHDELTLWTDVAAKSPYKPRAYNNLAVYWHSQGDHRKAAGLIQKAIDVGGPSAKAFFNLGVEHKMLGDTEQAFRYWNEAIRLKPDFELAAYNMCDTYSELGKNSEALEWCRRTLEINPRSAMGWNGIGLVYRSLGRRPEAIEAFLRAVRINPDASESYNNLGVVYQEAGRTAEAIAAYREALRIDPRFKEAADNLAQLGSESPNTRRSV